MPLLRKRLQRFEQAFDVGLGQRGGRFVEHENVSLDRQRPADGDERTLGGRERRDRRVRVDVAADHRERVRCGLANAPPGHQAQRRARITGLDCDILGDRHPFDEAEILVNERDRQPVCRGTDRPAVERDLARVGFVDAGQDLDQGRLAGAVLTEQRVNFATTKIEVDLIEGERRGEALDEPAHQKERSGPPVAMRVFDSVHDRPSRATIAPQADESQRDSGGGSPPEIA